MKNWLLSLLIFIAAWGLGPGCGAQELRIALVQGQFNAQLEAEEDFALRTAQGQELTIGKGKYFLHVEAGQLVLGEQRFQGRLTIAPLPGKELPKLNRAGYRGSLQVAAQGQTLLVLNLVELEDYLYSVLPPKTMPVWPDEVIKAQAVAARSYALYQARRHRAEAYDLAATDQELPYQGRGPRLEKYAISSAIHATAGQYLADRQGQPIEALTTSSSGGRTEAGEHYYLASVPDPDEDAPEREWERRVAPFLVQGLLEQRGYAVGKLQSIRLSPLKGTEQRPAQWGTDRSAATGRVEYLIFTGEKGTAQVSGEEFRQMLDLNSTLFDIDSGLPVPESLQVPISNYWGAEVGHKDIPIKINPEADPVWKDVAANYHLISDNKEEKLIIKGRGKGQGRGLSCWGARGLYNGNTKLTYRELLAYYYPGTSLSSL